MVNLSCAYSLPSLMSQEKKLEYPQEWKGSCAINVQKKRLLCMQRSQNPVQKDYRHEGHQKHEERPTMGVKLKCQAQYL